jgi:hypothetical protein
MFEAGTQHEVIHDDDDDDDDGSSNWYSAPHIMLVSVRHVACIAKVQIKCTHTLGRKTDGGQIGGTRCTLQDIIRTNLKK